MPILSSTLATASEDRGSNRCEAPANRVKVLVTGGAGFIGSNLCRRLQQQAGVDEIVALDDLSTGSWKNLDGCASVELIEGSIVREGDIDAAVNGVDAIVHLAARPSVPRSLADPLATHTVNATGTMMVLEAARRHGMPHVVVASSSSVYGANPALPKRESMQTLPASPYAASKLATESYTLAYGRSFGLPVLAFRFFNVFGPYQPADHAYAAVIPAFISAALAGRPLPIDGDGTQSRDFTFVDTVTSVLADAVCRKVVDAEPVNLAFGSRVSLLELIEQLEEVMGHPLERDHRVPRPGDVPHSQADSSRLRTHFPDIEPDPLAKCLRTTVAWLRKTS